MAIDFSAKVLDAAYRVHGTAASYRPGGAAAAAVEITVMLGRPDATVDGGILDIRAPEATVRMRAAEAAAKLPGGRPRAGDVIVMPDGQEVPVTGDGRHDAERLEFEVPVRPGD